MQLIFSSLSFLLSISAVFISAFQAYIYSGPLRVSQDQEIRQLRAYIGSPYAGLREFKPPNGFYIVFNAKNYGLTPGYKIYYNWGSRNKNYRDDSRYSPDLDNPYNSVGGATVFPGSDVLFAQNIKMAVDATDDFNHGKRLMTFYGIINYIDIFNTIRYTNFCYLIDKEDIENCKKNKKEIALAKCANFNDGT